MKNRLLAILLTAILVLVAAMPAAATGADQQLPFADQGYAGYFVFEARGNKVPAASVTETIGRWAKEAFGVDDVQLDPMPADGVATGSCAILHVGSAEIRYGIIVVGDAAKTGNPGISQLVAIARALQTGLLDDPVALAAADLNGSGKVDLADLVAAARYLQQADPEGPLLPGAPCLLPRNGAVSDNLLAQNYSVWSRPVDSYLYENEAGNLVRVEHIGDKVIVEEYNQAFQPEGTARAIDLELPLWGGFFAGEQYNFLIFGQSNMQEDNACEVIRIVKYDKNWTRLSAASLRGGNTTVPFDAGSLRCAEYGGMLYVKTCHKMYTSSDGLNHQANVMLAVRESDMQITDSNTGVSYIATGYVSHSFNQFVLVDQYAGIVAADHGDAYPRGGVMMRYRLPAGSPTFMVSEYYPSVQAVEFVEFPGAVGANYTGASIGGLAATSHGYVAVYNSDGTSTYGAPRDVYLAFVSNDESVQSGLQRLTTGARTLTPQVVPTGLDGGYVLWMDGAPGDNVVFSYAPYSADGSVGQARTADAAVSDCQPIVWQGRVVWYVTDSSAPIFYTLDDTGVRVY